MFTFENGPDIETVSNASEFLGNSFNIWVNDSVPWYIVSEEGRLLLDGFIIEMESSLRNVILNKTRAVF
jgi:hypothetical protein